jgi:glyoxylase-like metal-dependent hydrolase (beta-lactamase superfamily II)
MTIKSKYVVRVNGRGNAWPIPLGETHPFYDISNYEDFANASFSIIKYSGKNYIQENIEWEVLIDAGHGAVQYLLKNSNRIPEAIFLTHPHIDHTLGIDWIIQSHYRKHKTKYTIYSTLYCWETVKQSFPHLIDMVDFYELIYGESTVLFDELKLTCFPAYHGHFAFGSSILLFALNNKKIMFTGDILLPMLLKRDLKIIHDVDLLVADANNRFPYPKSNHWSITNSNDLKFDDKYYETWFNELTSLEMIAPHNHKMSSKGIISYLNAWHSEFSKNNLVTNIYDFTSILNASNVWLVHYSGKEDEKHHNHKILNDRELTNWVNNNKPSMLNNTFFNAVKSGNTYHI